MGIKIKEGFWKIAQNAEFQQLTQDRMNKEINGCISCLVDDLAKDQNYTDELLPVLTKEDWVSAAVENKDSDPELYSEFRESIENDFDEADAREYCERCDIDPEFNEALEHWLVSSWLYDKLETRGEMVTEFKGLRIWGRTTSGQSISIDSVIVDIFWSYCLADSEQKRLAEESGATFTEEN